MSTYRIIIAGKLEFGNIKVFQQVYNQYEHRRENYYKETILLKPEDAFNEEELCFDVTRTVVTGTEREWLNTKNLLEQVVDYSISGSIHLWRLGAGKMLDDILLEPTPQRTTVQMFNKGREMIDQRDKVGDALKMLTRVVDRFDRHAQAYERRGYINMKLGNVDDALYDYNKSLKISPALPEAHYGRGLLLAGKGDWEGAAADFDAVTKNSIPHQDIYWMAQVALGDSYRKLGRPVEALRVYNMFSKRKQRMEKLEPYDRRVDFELAKLLHAAGRQNDAVEVFERSLTAAPDGKAPGESEIRLTYAETLAALGRDDEANEQRKLAAKKKITKPAPAPADPQAAAMA